MKSKGLLLCIFVSLLVCFQSLTIAQTKANYNVDRLQEIGPNNIGGRVSCLIANGDEIYAGAALGGLYRVSMSNWQDAWQFVPCYLEDGSQLTLPITTLASKGNDLFIGTGEYGYMVGNNIAPMAARGRGLWKMTRSGNNNSFSCLINPADDNNFTYINELCIYENGSVHRQFAATETGLFTTDNDWQTYTKIFDGQVRDLELVANRKVLYFTIPGAIYRISNVEDAASVSAPICISNNDATFATAGGNIRLAVAPSDPTYIYALLFNSKGAFEGVYLSRDQQTWMIINTSSVTPFSSLRNGLNCGTIIVDRGNPKRIYVGGETIWAGQGYVDNSFYQWTMCSYSEAQMNMGNYMATVYNNATVVHSGIKQILPLGTTFLIATNGGVYLSTNELAYFTNISYGINAVQVVDFDICPDGSIIMGANDMASPFIASRTNHYGGDTNVNNSANILFTGSGGQPAASRYQKYSPSPHRGIFVSANNLQFGRSYNDYSDYTQTQTWTTGQAFLSNTPDSGYYVPRMLLWETNNNTVIHDTTPFVLDTLGSIIRNNVEIQLNKDSSYISDGIRRDTVLNTLPFTIQPGDKVRLAHPSFFGYPFEHTFTESFTISEHNTKIRVPSPLHSRLFINSTRKEGKIRYSSVLMTWTPTDFRKVWDAEDVGKFAYIMSWTEIVEANSSKGHDIRQMAVSNDGDAVFAAVSNSNDSTYYILRVRGLNAVEINDTNKAINIYYKYSSSGCQTIRDTIKVNGTPFFSRPITSLTYDPHNDKDRLIVTFGGENSNEANVMLINNATSDNYSHSVKSLSNTNIPAYSSMVEFTTGDVYVGTEDGVFKASASSFEGTPSWSTYGEFAGVPVTSMHQQLDTLKRTSIVTHNGINVENNVFMKTKYPYAMYFGTYGRGIFVDTTYVTDKDNETLNPDDYEGIQTIAAGTSRISVYPNPATSFTTLDITLAEAGNTIVRVLDMSGKVVFTENLGRIDAGNHKTQLNCQNLRKGIYIVNVVSGKATATSKLVVR